MKVLLVILALTALVAVWTERERTAAQTVTLGFALPARGCPTHFELVENAQLADADYQVFGRNPVDDNQDGRFCQLLVRPSRYQGDRLESPGLAVIVDNDLPPGSVGKCPVSFTEVLEYGRPEDLNGNGLTCELARSDESGMIAELIVADDIDR